jgi:lipid A 3-O-deacylase
MKRTQIPQVGFAFFLLIAGLGWVAPENVQADDAEPPRREHATWRFETANDAVFDTDNQFTNGFTFQKHSAASADVNDLQGVAAFGTGLARRLLPQDSDLLYRKALTIGQNFATPTELEDPEIILDDVPYFGFLGAESSWIAFNDTRFTGFAITLGVVGEYSFAEEVQKGVHSLIDAQEPMGWEHQLDNELGVNFHYMKKRKLWNNPSFDGAFNFDLSVGNLLTGLDAGIEMRFGRKPGGFSYVYDPIGRNMAYDATLPRQDGRTEFYGTLTLRAWAWAVFMPLEGNTFTSDNEWTDNNTIEPEQIVGQAIVGFHYVRPKWGMHATLTFATDNIDPDSLTPGTDVDNNFFAYMFEWRF